MRREYNAPPRAAPIEKITPDLFHSIPYCVRQVGRPVSRVIRPRFVVLVSRASAGRECRRFVTQAKCRNQPHNRVQRTTALADGGEAGRKTKLRMFQMPSRWRLGLCRRHKARTRPRAELKVTPALAEMDSASCVGATRRPSRREKRVPPTVRVDLRSVTGVT
jgi:hypothetical protein